MNFTEQLGKNIRDTRQLRGFSLQDLSNEISKRQGVEISPSLVGMWERGERRISAENLNYLCDSLGCTPNLLFPGYNEVTAERLVQELSAIPIDEQKIMEYASIHWDGNTHALIRFAGLYMALPRSLREEIVFVGISMFEYGLRNNMIDKECPIVDLDYIRDQWKLLLKNRTSIHNKNESTMV